MNYRPTNTASRQRSPIFVVSLLRSQDRRQEIAARLQSMGLEFEFFDAIDGWNIPAEYDGLVDEQFRAARKSLGRKLSRGEVGCALSHALIYERIVREEIASAYILEDDAIPVEQFARLVHRGALEQDSRIELATFRYHSLLVWRGGGIELSPEVSLCRPMQLPLSTLGYYLTRAAAERLQEAALPVSATADWPAAVHRWSGTYCVCPRLVDTHLEDESSILHAERAILEAEKLQVTEIMALVSWPTPYRIAARLLSLTLLPCLLWPTAFGTVSDTRNFVRRAQKQLRERVQRLVESFLERSFARRL